MKLKSLEIFIPGPAGRLEAKYYKNPKFGSPVAIVLHPHPQYGGTMNNRIVQLMYNIFLENGFLIMFWCHFLAVNLFCGAWIVSDSIKLSISKFLTFFPLLITYFIGPLGLFIYWLIRIFFARRMSLYD